MEVYKYIAAAPSAHVSRHLLVCLLSDVTQFYVTHQALNDVVSQLHHILV